MAVPKETSDEPAGKQYPGLPRREPDFPELSKMREFDEKMHEERARKAGLTPEQAARHAKEDLADGEADAGRE